jgi:hypothetical protein
MEKNRAPGADMCYTWHRGQAVQPKGIAVKYIRDNFQGAENGGGGILTANTQNGKRIRYPSIFSTMEKRKKQFEFPGLCHFWNWSRPECSCDDSCCAVLGTMDLPKLDLLDEADVVF